MNFDNYQQRKEKWERKSREYQADSLRRATFVLTVQNALELLREKRRGKMLDVGCGFGEIDVLLTKNTDFNIVGFDISENAIKIARDNVREASFEDRIKIEQGDIYNLNYPDNSFDAVVSFGYVSAATYPGVQKDIVRVLKPGGVLICDFINCLSFYKFLGSLRRIMNKNCPYYLSLSGIRREFEKEGLIFMDQRFFNTYPPLDLKLNPKVFLAFENTIGRISKNLLGRVRLVSFQKPKS